MALSAHSQPWWTITRASGALALAGFVAAGVLGVLLARSTTGSSARVRVTRHRHLVKASMVALGIHIASALLDRHHVPPYAVVAPFLSPVRRIAAGTGALAVWGLVVVTVTAVSRQHFRRSWRAIHRYVSYPAAALALVHTLFGTDLAVMGLSGASLAVFAVGRFILRDDVAPRRAGSSGRAEAQPRRTLIRGSNAGASGAGQLRSPRSVATGEPFAAEGAAGSCPPEAGQLQSRTRGNVGRACLSKQASDARPSGVVSEERLDASFHDMKFALALQSFEAFVEDLRQ